MKKTATLSVYAAALGLFAVCGGLSEANAQVKAGKAMVTTAGEGSRYSTSADVWLPLKTGGSLPEGAVIATAGKASVLSMEGSVIAVQPNSTLKLDRLAGGSAAGVKVIDTQLNLADGAVGANVRKLAAGARYEVKTPGGVAGIRGTKIHVYTTTVNGKRITIYSSVEGTCDVAETTPGGVVTVVLNKGESFITGDVAVGETVTIPGVGTFTITGKPFGTPTSISNTINVPDIIGSTLDLTGGEQVLNPEDNTSAVVRASTGSGEGSGGSGASLEAVGGGQK
jgi:hypothetical protein